MSGNDIMRRISMPLTVLPFIRMNKKKGSGRGRIV